MPALPTRLRPTWRPPKPPSEVVWPNSSLIISDEGPSRETGKDTDFVVVMSGEPQGALKIRQREPMPMDGWGRPFRGLPFFWN